MENNAYLTIFLMAVATYLTRIGGFFIASKVKMTPRLEAALAAMPGSLLTAILLPIIIKGGPAELAASAIVIFLASKGKGLLFCLISGLAVLQIIRQFI